MKTQTAIRLVQIISILLTIEMYANAQGRRNPRKVYDYNSTVQWSQSPFDASTINDDSPSLKKDLQDYESETPSIEPPNNMGYPANNYRNSARSRNRTESRDKDDDLLSEPVEDVESIINDSKQETTDESGWGWLADDILQEQKKKNTPKGHTSEDPFNVNYDDNEYSDTQEYSAQQRARKSKTGNSSHYRSAIRKHQENDVAQKDEKQQKQPGSWSDHDAAPKQDTEDNYVFSQWEKDLGLNKPITERSGTGLRSSEEITKEITQKMLYSEHDESTPTGKSYSPSSTSRQNTKRVRETSRYKSTGNIQQPEDNLDSFNSRFNTSPPLSREGPAFSGTAPTRFKGNSISPNTSSFTTSSPKKSSTTPSLFNTQKRSSSFDMDQQPKSSNLETFRKMHKSDGIYRPFGGSSSSWAD